jgi:hypothetical protein
VLRSPGRFASVFLWTLAHWLLAAWSLWLGFQAVGITAPFTAALFLNGVSSLASAVPSSPGFFGVFESVSKVALRLYGVPATLAVSWALGYHVLTFIPITVFGAVYAVRLGLGLRELTGGADDAKPTAGGASAGDEGGERTPAAAPRDAGRPRPRGARPRTGAREAVVRAQAKVNLYLRVLAREEDGYHQIETLFQRLELGDGVRVRVGPGSTAIDRRRGSAVPPGGLGPTEHNLAWRAAVAYARRPAGRSTSRSASTSRCRSAGASAAGAPTPARCCAA